MKKLGVILVTIGVIGAITAQTQTTLAPVIPPYPGDATKFLAGDAQWRTGAGGGGGAGTNTVFENVSGTIKYSGGQAATNVLHIVSGQANNPTNVVAIFDTAVAWTPDGSGNIPNAFLIGRNMGSNVFMLRADGGFEAGRGAFDSGGVFQEDIGTIEIVRDVSRGDAVTSEIYSSLRDSPSEDAVATFQTGQRVDSPGSATSFAQVWAYDTNSALITTAMKASRASASFSIYDSGSRYLFWTEPFIIDANPIFGIDSFITHTSGPLFLVKNNNTNKFAVAFDGAITTGIPAGGTAAAWKLGINGSVPRIDVNGTGQDVGDVRSSGTPTDGQLAIYDGIGGKAIKPGTSIVVSAALGSDDTYNGTQITGLNNSGGVTQWDAVYLNGSSQWVLADANGAGTFPCRGLASATVATATATTVITSGTIRNDAWTWTPGGNIYLSSTAGGLTQTAPATTGDAVQIVGYALTADIMMVAISPDVGTAP